MKEIMMSCELKFFLIDKTNCQPPPLPPPPAQKKEMSSDLSKHIQGKVT